MPFDFSEYKHYSIDYFQLYNEINSKIIFDDKNIQHNYIRAWINTLQNSDRVITHQLSTSESILKLRLNIQSEPEIFQLPIKRKNNEILVHFRVSIANQMISQDKPIPNAVSIKKFREKNSNIYWTPVNGNVDSYAMASNPIILVPFFTSKTNQLVIDGNHRLTYKTKHNIDSVDAILISQKSVIENNLFSSTFDKYYYIMNNELTYMIIERQIKHINALNLIKQSYLVDGRFKLNEEKYFI